MCKLTIEIDEAGECGLPVITFTPVGQPTTLEETIANSIRRSVLAIACRRKCATKYQKGTSDQPPAS